MAFKAGDRVQIAAREVSVDDEKSGLYYSYFGGLTGTVNAVYGDGSVCLEVDLESLSPAARDRHLEMQEAERKRWLDGLSGEMRNRLSAEQKQLKLSYKVLVSSNDLEPSKGGKPNGGKKSAKSSIDSSEDTSPSAQKGPARAPEPVQARDEGDSVPHRLSAEDLAIAEEEYLKSLRKES